MSDEVFPGCREVCEYWSRAVTSLVRNHWKLLDTQYGAGIQLLGAVAGESVASSGLETLEQYALERASKGLPPPREVYDAQNRNRIDWSRFPEWARPIDPEVFEGSTHEG